MSTSTISLTFANKVNASLQVGGNDDALDDIYMVNTDGSVHHIGGVSAISNDRKTVTVKFTTANNPKFPTANTDYVFFKKKDNVNSGGLSGYYAETKMLLTGDVSTLKSELFAVGSEVAISSK